MQGCGRLQGRGLCPFSPQGLKVKWLTTHTTIRQCYWFMDRTARAECIFHIVRNKNAYLLTLSKVFMAAKENNSELFMQSIVFLFWPDVSDDLFPKLTCTAQLEALHVRICHRISFVSSCLLKHEKNINILKTTCHSCFFVTPFSRILSWSAAKKVINKMVADNIFHKPTIIRHVSQI